jgi:hypothetical protein
MKIHKENLLIIYPFVLVASFYATWLAGRYHLGHWPQPSNDDPKYIPGFWMWTYDFTTIVLFVGLPLVLVLSIYSLLKPPPEGSPRRKRATMQVYLGILLLALAFVFMGSGYFRHIIIWYLD